MRHAEVERPRHEFTGILQRYLRRHEMKEGEPGDQERGGSGGGAAGAGVGVTGAAGVVTFVGLRFFLPIVVARQCRRCGISVGFEYS